MQVEELSLLHSVAQGPRLLPQAAVSYPRLWSVLLESRCLNRRHWSMWGILFRGLSGSPAEGIGQEHVGGTI